ncbi:MarR family winged helix-turn-helix transcriptional regulator [Paenactinomyces guangxiensis]|uniref:MarR family transcriptional regulator n=1 Tax=Paenactinomyces guangxiensis TaxID=1490290 RepID=A0A7W2A8T2_9BACL|nr:MarR family transcriptional regulator [Paenactinomyces guangxiensis]MBA4494524.1 MarR family transcriptional regulator [Paenactinomyces guangxiensis]MBH8591714.1 MarR family transcriptional regulator [Paenactinomyces guangxiensis]
MSDRLDLIMELEQTFFNLGRHMRKELGKIWGDTLTGAEFGVLKQLHLKSPQIVTALSHEFEVSVSHITHVADQLEKKNLACRKRSQLDKRVVELHITDEGKQLVEETSKKKTEYFRQKFENLTTEEIKTLLQLLQKIV